MDGCNGWFAVGFLNFNYCLIDSQYFTFVLKKEAFVIYPSVSGGHILINNNFFNIMNLCIWEILLNQSGKNDKKVWKSQGKVREKDFKKKVGTLNFVKLPGFSGRSLKRCSAMLSGG